MSKLKEEMKRLTLEKLAPYENKSEIRPSNEEKARFFRTCIGDYILERDEDLSDMQWLIHSVDLNGNVWLIHEKNDEPVLLDDPDRLYRSERNELSNIAVVKYSLSSISDEDAIEVGKILGLEGFNSGYIINLVKAYLGNHFHGSLDISADIVFIHIIDYLRSRSYALPFNGWSIEQMISFGWIKIKEI